VSDRREQPDATYSVAYPPEQLVGREQEQKDICRAITEGKRVIYLEGQGGIGKTRLLTEAPDFIPKGIAERAPVVLGIVDFYDTAMHSSIALDDALADRIRAQSGDETLFQDFSRVLEQYRAGHAEEKRVHEAFARAFNDWIEDRHAVFCFDTAEALESGRDAEEVVEECEIEGEEAPAARWIQKNLRDLNNATLLIAGRPTRTLHTQLRASYPPDLWMDVSLEAFSLEEAYQYFKASPYGRDEDRETIERIWLLSGGRPILLSLAIDWLYRGVQLQELYKDELEDLRRLAEEASAEWQSRREQFEIALIRKTRLLTSPMDAAVYYAARARKGFTAHMLYQVLTDDQLPFKRLAMNREDAEALVEELSQLSFVKHPYGAREGWYFLHDEMYDLLDRHIWRVDYPTYTHQAETARFLAEEVYGDEDRDGLIAGAAERVREAGPHIDLLRTRRKLNILKAERLFYMLEADPESGYRSYQSLDVQAIDQGELEWDDILRVELLRFMNTFPYWAKQRGLVKEVDQDGNALAFADFVNRDARALWVHRFHSRGDYEKAIRIARKLLEKYPDWEDSWRARILVGIGSSLVRQGEKESVPVLQEALQILERPGLEGDPWAIQHYTGMAYLYLGLRARAEWNLKEAASMYEKAHETFQDNDEYIEAARALNNSAFILVKQGEYQQAMENVRQAMDIRDEFGDVIGKGLSLNTLAIAVDRSGQPINAWRHGWDALRHLQLAKENEYPGLDRAIAMIHINLGRIQRHRARQERPHLQERVMSNWQRAEEHLLKALELADRLEPYYEFDLYNQLGLLYSNWANWTFTRGPQDRERFFQFMEKANHYFELADRFADEKSLFIDQADNREDWAWVCHLRRAYAAYTGDEMSPEELQREVFDRLKSAEKLARDSVDDINQKGLQAYYILASVHHQRGRFIDKFLSDDRSALHEYALAVAYYDHFAVNPLDPLERRERVREHVRYTLERILDESSEEAVEEICDQMRHDVEREGLPSKGLRSWLESVLADLTWE
jgi:tetratricopeptide (TPR) repeat protein